MAVIGMTAATRLTTTAHASMTRLREPLTSGGAPCWTVSDEAALRLTLTDGPCLD